MRRSAARGAIACATALGSIGAVLVVATPAAACSCSWRDVDQEVGAGRLVAVVTGTADPDTYKVLASTGPAAPAELSVDTRDDGGCASGVAPGLIGALVFERRKAGWHLGACAEPALAPAFEEAMGRPVPEAGGPAVAYAAGGFGGARVVALDRLGRTVAWDGRSGYGARVALCPGGRTVTAVGRGPSEAPFGGPAELTVHDAADLSVRRAVGLPIANDDVMLALRCRDSRADRVDVVVRNLNGKPSRLLTAAGSRVTERPVGDVDAAVAVADGFVAVLGQEQRSLVHLSPAGNRRIAALGRDGAGFALSPDGRTAAVFGHRERGRPPVVTLDVRTGRRLGEVSPEGFIRSFAWLGPDRLVARREAAYREAPAPLPAYDRTLRPAGEWHALPDNAGWGFEPVGDAVVSFGMGSRLTVLDRSGTPRVVENVRLAAAEDVVGVPARSFAPGATGASAAGASAAGAPGRPGATPVVLGLGVAVSAGAAVVLAARRRRRP